MVCVKNVRMHYLKKCCKNIFMKTNFFEIKEMFSKLCPWLFVIMILLFFDQISKWIIRNNFEIFESKQLTPFLALTYTTNTGISFGLFEGNNNFFILTTIVILFILIFSVEAIEQDFGKIGLYSIILIISGGIGNLLDRIFFGRVIDFIDIQFRYKNIWPIFNLADSYVFIGVWILVISFVLQRYKKI